MKSFWRASGAVVAALAAALLAAGCASATATRHNTLVPLAQTAPPGVISERSLGVGPVRLPPYLRPASLVRRTSAYRVAYSDVDVWADPLEESVTEVVAENLARLTGAHRVGRHPWRPSDAPERQLVLDIRAFELAQDGQAELAVRWELRDAHGALLEAGEAAQRQPANGQTRDLAEALSRALLALSRDLAAVVTR